MLGEPGHGKSSLCMKMVSDFYERKFCPKGIRKVFSFSLNPTVWIKESENSLDVKNIFILINEEIIFDGKYKEIRLSKEHLMGSLIFLDGYDELYLRLQESSINTLSFLERLENLSKSWNLKFIITSRKTCMNLSELDKNGYKICLLEKLTQDEQKKWINNVYNKLFFKNPYDVKKMYDVHQMNNVQSKILELLGIPILLQLIVSKYFYSNAQNTVELYDKLFEEILQTRKEMIIDSFDENRTEDFKQIFESYAYNIYKNNDTYVIIESEELKEDKNKKWKSVLLFYVKNEKNKKNHYIEFIHRSFYQYFQAWYFYHLVLKIIQEDKGNSKKEKVANLFEAICWKRIERDVIDMIKQISKNQKEIQTQDQIKYILDIFEETDGIIKTGGKWSVPIGELNSLDKVETMLYNLLMILNIILSTGLILFKNSRLETLMKKFDMSGIYLPKIVLSNLNLDTINLKNATLIRAHLESTNIARAHLEGVDLRAANLEKVNLTWANLVNTNLEMANLEMANLINADLSGANLTWANLTEASLTEANLVNTNLERANLTKINLTRANLGGANLTGAYLEEANLQWTYLKENFLKENFLKENFLKWKNSSQTNLKLTYLEKANLKDAIFDPIILKDAILENTKISKEKHGEITALGIDISGIIWCD